MLMKNLKLESIWAEADKSASLDLPDELAHN